MNKKIVILINLLMTVMMATMLWACGSETSLVGEESSTDATISVSESNSNSYIRVTINSSSASSITVTRATRETQTTEEKSIENLYVYLFELSDDATDYSDDSFVYYNVYPFTVADDADADETEYIIDDGNGNMTGAIEITDEMLNKVVKVVVLANDQPATELTAGSSTLGDFKQELATASVSDGDNVDVLVGNPEDAATGYPMSATAYVDNYADVGYNADTDAGEWAELTLLGVDMSADLTRNVARLDVFNYIPNLSITNVYVTNTANQSFLFPQYDDEGDVDYSSPTGASFIQLNAYTGYTTDGTFKTFSYITPDEDTEDAARELNTLEHVLYLYEQEVTDESTSPIVVIEYSIDLTTTTQWGYVKVPFFTTSDDGTDGEYVDVIRNHCYSIKIGDGEKVTGDVEAKLVVSDWEEEGEVIETTLDATVDEMSTTSDNTDDTDATDTTGNSDTTE